MTGTIAHGRPAVRPSPPLVRRPQPLGVFPLPLGYLLVPAVADDVRAALVTGRVPVPWPDELRAHERAYAGDVAGALAELTGEDPVSRYNWFVLDPDGSDPDALRACLGPELGVLVDLVLFSLGRTDAPPALGAATGEIAALVLAAHATHLGIQDPAEPQVALALLERAVIAARPASPPLAGLLLAASAEVRRATAGASDAVLRELEEALRLLSPTQLPVARAELHLELGSVYQELATGQPELAGQAVRQYHAALTLAPAGAAPELFATAHANLAAAYLTMPMAEASQQLRLGIAIRSLRAALTVFRPETHPRQWASAQLNLANALVYAPSLHRGDNLVEAVELYEAVINARARGVDPLGLARALANQGNALAHLGAFDAARAKLAEARELFDGYGEHAAARDVRSILDEIDRRDAPAAAAGAP